MNIIKYSILINILLFGTLLYSQSKSPGEEEDEDYAKIVPPSPTAYELGKYGQIPVGYFTGTPNVTVPLYNYKAGQLTVPISLSYNSNGIKVDELETNVGLGWSLNIGGVITRIVRDSPDEASYQFYPEGEIHEAGTYSKMAMDYFIGAAIGDIDSESDLYMYNFNGYSGKFVFDNNKRIVLMPHQNLQIVANCNDSSEIFYEITAPDGIKYIFSTIERTRYYKQLKNGTDEQNVPVITAWYLTQIIHPAGDHVDFEYEFNEYTFGSSISQFYNKSLNTLNGCPGGPWCGQVNNIQTYKNFSTIFGERIKQISSNNIADGTIIIDYNQSHPNPEIYNYQLISNISVHCNNDIIDNFSFNYFPTNNNRMFLDNVTFKDQTKQYHFDYIEPDILCERLAYSQDYWGYFNNKTNAYFVPKVDAGVFYDSPWSGDRNLVNLFSQKGLLKKVIYPTKGYNEFEYEANSYWGTNTIYPPKAIISLEAITGENLNHFTDTIITATIPTNHDAFFHSSVAFNYDDNGCDTTGYPFDIKAHIAIKNLNTNEFIDIFKFSNVIGWNLVGQSLDIFEGDFAEYKVNFESGNSYEVTLKVIRPCLWSTMTLEYYDQEIEHITMNIETGGSRIKKIVAKDPITGNENIMTYYYNKYDNLSESSGDPGTMGYFISKRINRMKCSIPCSYFDCEYYVLGSESQIPLVNSGNSNIYYRYVTVSNGGENFENGGETHEFIINRDVPGNPLINTGFAQNGACYSNIGWDNGLEKSVEVFKIANNEKILLTNTKNFYKQDNRNFTDAYSYSVMKNFDMECTRNHHYTCTAADANKKWKRIACNTNHHHFYWKPGVPFDGSDDPICIAPGASNSTYWQYHPCWGTPGLELVYQDQIENLNIIEYINYSFWSYLDSTSIIEYDQDGNNPITTFQKYYYDNDKHIQLTRTLKKDSKGNLIEEGYWYPEDFIDIENFSTLIDKHIISSPVKSEVYSGDKIINGKITKYDDYGMPIEIYSYENENLITKPLHDPGVITTIPGFYIKKVDLRYNQNTKKLSEQQLINNFIICYIWGYNYTQVIAKIENSNYNDAVSLLGCSIDALQNKTEVELLDIFNTLRADLQEAMITSYTFKPLVGMTSETDPAGKTTHYEYDEFGRLVTIRDQDGKVIKHMDYHYAEDEK
jgi:YD repeat-containing protein